VLHAAKAGSEIRIYNPDNPFNNAAHIDDLCRFVSALLEGPWSGHHAVTVGAKGTTTTRQAVQIILDSLKSTSQVIVSPAAREGFNISSDYASRAFGYQPMDIADMLRLFAESNVGISRRS
jgi:nucleoside-diphosphate-sugar epimerase